MKVCIENIVATITLNQPVKFKPLVRLRNVTKPVNFPALVLRHDVPDASSGAKRQLTFLIFETGKVVAMRTKTLQQLHEAERAVTSLLRSIGAVQPSTTSTVDVQNIVATVVLDGLIDLEICAGTLTKVIYEPHTFPGVIFHVEDPPKATFLLFSSGKVVCLGTKNESDLQNACDRLERTLLEKNLLYRDQSLANAS